MKGREIDFIPDRLIEEPVVFKGLTDTEVIILIGVGIVFWIPVCMLLLYPFGFSLFGVGLGFGMAIATLLTVGKYLQSLKRRMPDGLHVVFLRKWAQKKFSMMDFGYIDVSQRWDIRRDQQVIKEVFEERDY